MDKTCNPEQLYERKFERGELPIKSCVECLFNVLCNDYIIHEESNDWMQKVLKADWEERN